MLTFEGLIAQAAYGSLVPADRNLLPHDSAKLENMINAALARSDGLLGINAVIDSFGIPRRVEVRKGQDAEATKQFDAYHNLLRGAVLFRDKQRKQEEAA